MDADGDYDPADVYGCEGAYYESWQFLLASTLGSTMLIIMCLLTMRLRSFIRERDNIPTTLCAGMDDCVLACCCMPCVQCQIMRHEGMVASRYTIVSCDGTVAEML